MGLRLSNPLMRHFFVDELEEVADFRQARGPGVQLLQVHLRVAAEILAQEGFNFFVGGPLLQLVEAVAGIDAVKQHELHFFEAQPALLIEVEHFEQELNLVFEASIAEKNKPAEHFEGVYAAPAFYVPYCEGIDTGPEDLRELGVVECEALADEFEGGVVLPQLHGAAVEVAQLQDLPATAENTQEIAHNSL